MKKIALFPGSFDPFTRGHEDIVRRGIKIFDEVIIAIGHNSNKKRFFELEEMVSKINEVFKEDPGITIEIFQGLTAEFARKKGAQYLLRGLRNTTDFEYENTLSQANSYLNEDLETVFLITEPNFAHISSSVVRDVFKYGGDVSKFLPYKI